MSRRTGLVAALVDSLDDLPPRVATRLIVGPRYTAVGGTLRPDSPQPDACGLAYTGAGEGPAAGAPGGAADLGAPAVHGRLLRDLAGLLLGDAREVDVLSGAVAADPAQVLEEVARPPEANRVPGLRRVTVTRSDYEVSRCTGERTCAAERSPSRHC